MIPAVSLWQPWASLVAVDAKPFETRHWPPPRQLIGRRIAIHAAKRLVWEQLDYDLRAAIWEALTGRAPAHEWPLTVPLHMPSGAVVCTAVLTDAYQCGETDRVGFAKVNDAIGPGALRWIETDVFGDYSPGRWAWHLTAIQPLKPPVPARGRQGIWSWDERSAA